MDVLDHLGLIESNFVGSRIDDAHICLVSDEQTQIASGQIMFFEHACAQLFHLAYGEFKDRLAVLMDEVHLPIDGFVR